jgi:para-aminobenzoate synthetase component I
VRPIGALISDHPAAAAVAARCCAGRVRERSRLEWRRPQGGDPAALVEDFLTEAGLPVRDLAEPPAGVDHDRDPLCGATLFVSAAAGADLAGARPGAASPVPAVPDVVAVVWEHDRAGAASEIPGAGPAPGIPDHPGHGPLAAGWRLGRWQAGWTARQHAAAVSRVRRAIGRGDVYQVNVVGHAAAAYLGDPLPALGRVAALPGSRYPGLLRGAGWAIACASPETLVRVSAARVVTRPIKGTRPATAAGRADLLGSAKERAEHVMIVDLERNDLARVARTGSVRVDRLFAVRRWCDLWQAESQVSARLGDGVGLADLLRATCPGGSVTGAPKLAALDLIARLEPVGRGPAMGALGWVEPGYVDLGLTIRTAAADPERVHVWAGGGITWGSDPAAEVDEAAAKAAPLRAALAGPAAGPIAGPAARPVSRRR